MGTANNQYYFFNTIRTDYILMLVEVSGIEPLTSCMPCKRSPS